MNRAIQIYAEKIFPPNVRCQTIHSLAYARIGYLIHIIHHEHEYYSIHFSRHFDGYLGNLRIKNIVDIVNDRPLIGEKGRTINSLYIRARFVYNTLNNFIASADTQITDEHVDSSSSLSGSESNSQLILTLQEKKVSNLYL